MTGLVRTHYHSTTLVWRFYLDRLLRLLPHYFCIFFFTLVWFDLNGRFTDFIVRIPSVVDYVNNVLIVPLDFASFNNSSHFMLIPQAWSLGLEILFYITIPFILIYRVRMYAFVLSVSLLLLSMVGFLNSDWFGYRLLPGALCIFLIGSFVYDHRASIARYVATTKAVHTIGAGALVLVTVLLVGTGKFIVENRDIFVGVLLALVALALLAHKKRQPFDEFLGNISYGVFLNHMFIKWAVFGSSVVGVQVVGYLGLSIVLATVLYYGVERPILRARKDLRPNEKSPVYSAP